MAHESFEDPEVAALLNGIFVCVKVDREERPDIDRTYMALAIEMTGRGGWPLTIIMTPDKKPFFAATYIPKKGRFGQAGMMEILPRIKDLWDERRDETRGSAERMLASFQRAYAESEGPGPSDLSSSIIERGYDYLIANYDARNGGFGTAPKFPSPHNLLFLMRYWLRDKSDQALDMVKTTLQAMRAGGIFDHLGFGFHRYSTDAGWKVPHFEKMLYDQAMMAIAYTEAYQVTGEEEYARVVREIMDYVTRDLTSPEGGFFSAEDADSEGEEGRYYLWTTQELREELDREEMQMMIRLFDIHESGNFHGGRNILRLRSSWQDAAAAMKIDEGDLRSRLDGIRLKLLGARSRRERPFRDEKILTDWNGLMIAALAKASQALQCSEYALAARRAADFILSRMQAPEGRLFHRYYGEPGIQGSLDDYAFLAWGLIELYEALFEDRYLEAAARYSQVMLLHFWDERSGGHYYSPDDGEEMLVRAREFHDGAYPSGNSIAALNLMRLSRFTREARLEERALDTIKAAVRSAAGHYGALAMLLCSLDFALGPSHEIILVGRGMDEGMESMLRAVRTRFLPNKVIMAVFKESPLESSLETSARREQPLGAGGMIAGFAREMEPLDGMATAYICTGHRCLPPTTDPDEAVSMLQDPEPFSSGSRTWPKKPRE